MPREFFTNHILIYTAHEARISPLPDKSNYILLWNQVEP